MELTPLTCLSITTIPASRLHALWLQHRLLTSRDPRFTPPKHTKALPVRSWKFIKIVEISQAVGKAGHYCSHEISNFKRTVVWLSTLLTGRLYPQEIFLGYSFLLEAESLCQWKIPMTPSRIDKVTRPPFSRPTCIQIPRWPTSFNGEKRQDMSVTNEPKAVFCLFNKADIVLWKRSVSEHNYVH